jgi:hypothetical protein
MKRALANPFRKERRSPSWRRLVAKLTLVASLLFGSLLAAPGTAHAADYWTCGHRITTTYNQGWIRLTGMSGTVGRTDIRVTGPTTFGSASVYPQTAIATGWYWGGLNRTRITIANHPECTVFLQ